MRTKAGSWELGAEESTVTATALFLGERIDLRHPEGLDKVADGPLVVRVGEKGCSVLFRHGGICLLNVTLEEQRAFLDRIRPSIRRPHSPPDKEQIEIQKRDGDTELIREGRLIVTDFSIERLQLIGDVLAKSAALSHYESVVSEVFEQIEPMALHLRNKGRVPSSPRALLRRMGSLILILNHVIGRVEVAEKPELLWERSDLEKLYASLNDEFEIDERQRILNAKVDLISRSLETINDLLQHRRSLRVEWYIVILILVEIVISIYELIRGHQ